MTRQAIGEGAEFVIWPESSTPFRFEDDRAGRRADSRRWRSRRACRSCSAAISSCAAADAPITFYNSAFLVRPGRHDRRRLPQDAPGAVRRVRAGQEACSSSRRRSSRRCRDFSAGEEATLLPVGGHLVSTAICYEVVYPDLVRALRRRRQRAADDDHQRRVVRPDVGAVPALRAGLDARDRGGPLSGALRQHRHQRHRRSVRARGRAHRHLSAGGRRRRGAVPDDVDASTRGTATSCAYASVAASTAARCARVAASSEPAV